MQLPAESSRKSCKTKKHFKNVPSANKIREALENSNASRFSYMAEWQGFEPWRGVTPLTI